MWKIVFGLFLILIATVPLLTEFIAGGKRVDTAGVAFIIVVFFAIVCGILLVLKGIQKKR